MLHIKDIEAFARINEALARNGGASPLGLFGSGSETDEGGTERPRHPALLFARLVSGAPGAGAAMQRMPVGPAPAPVPSPQAANDAVAEVRSVPRPAAPKVEPDTVNPGDSDAALCGAADGADDDTVASVDAIPLACADVLPFPYRRNAHNRQRVRDAADSGADSVGGMAYDFDLVPHRPVTMVGMLTRMFFGRR